MAITPEVKIRISADGRQAVAQVDALTSGIQRSAAAGDKLTSSIARIGHYTAGAFALGTLSQYAAELVKTADAWQAMAGRLTVVAGSTQAATAAQTQLFQLAQSMRAPLAETVTLYTRMAPAMRDMGKSAAETLQVTESVGLALKISGATAQESASAMLQFSQAMASGALRGEEFNAINEASPRIMRALADSMGVPIGQLKKLAEEGRITSATLSRAMSDALPKLRDEYGKLPQTVGDAFTKLKNESAKAIGEFNQQIKGTEKLAAAINTLSDNIRVVGTVAEAAGAMLAGRLIAASAAATATAISTAAIALAARSAAAEMGLLTASATGLAGVLRGMSIASKGGWIGLLLFGAWELADYFGWLDGLKKKIGEIKTSLFGGTDDKLTLALQQRLALEERVNAARKTAYTWKDQNELKAMRDSLVMLDKEIASLQKLKAAQDEAAAAKARAARERAAESDRENSRFAQRAKPEERQDKDAQASLMNNALWRERVKQKEAAIEAEKVLFRKATAGVGEASAEYAAMLEKHNARVKAIKDKYDESKKPKAADWQDSGASKRFIAGIREQIAEMEAQADAQNKLSRADQLRIKLNNDLAAGMLKMTPAAKALARAEIDRLDALEKSARYAKQDAEDEALRVEWIKRSNQELAAQEQSIWGKVEAQIQANRVLGLSKTVTEELTLADMEQNLAWREALGLIDDETEALKRRIVAQRHLVAATRDGEAKQSGIDAGKAAAAEWQKTVDRIDQTFHDGFVGMLEKGKADWESFTDSLATTFKSAVADEIYKMTLKPLVLNVVGSFSGAGAPAVPGADGQPLSISNGFGVLSGAQAAWAGMSGGIANAASAFATSGMGQYLGLSSTAPIATGTELGSVQLAGAAGSTTGGAYLTGSGSSFVASAAPYAAAIAALAYGDHLMKAGWGLDNNRKGYAASAAGAVAGGVAAGASAGASAGSSGGPVGTVVGAVVGAIAVPVLDRLFGHNNKTNADAAGIQGSFDLSGFTGDQWQQFSKKGGTFRSDKRWTDTYDVSSDIDKELDSAFRKTVAKLQDIGKTLGVETSKSIDGFTHEFSLQLSENGDMSKAGEKLAAEIGRAADGLVAKMVPNIDEFARLGESASQTFSRLNQEVTATDAILLAMGKNAAEAFGGVGLASIAARENLIDLAGGLDNLASKTQFFYQNFYTSSEQLQLAGKQASAALSTGFAELGQAIPTSREAYRALVESQNLSTESGAKLFNALLDLADEFDMATKAADALTEMQKAAGESAANLTAKQLENLTAAKATQGGLFDTFASDAQKLAAAKLLVSSTFAEIGKAIPQGAGGFLALAQSIDPATEAGQALIAALQKVSGAFAYVQTAAAEAAKQASIKSFEAAKAALDGKSSGLTDAMQSLVDRFGNLSPVARTVADDLAATRQQLEGLSSGLSDLFNAAQMTDLQRLGKTVGQRDQIRSAVEQLNSDIFEAALKGMSRQDQIGQLKKAEADLWAGMGTAADKGQQASKIRDVLLRRLGLESDDAKDSAGKVAELANQARKDQIDTLKAQIDGMQRMRDLAGQIADFTANLSIGDLSPLSYADQLSAAQAQFEQTLSKAKGGDQQAQGQLTNNAKTYLDEARSYFASSTDYAAIYEKVTGSLKSIASPAESTLTAAQSQLDTLSKLPDVMAAMVDTSKDDVAALQAVQAALRSGDDYLTKSIDAQTVALQKQIDTLTTIASNQDAQIKQAGAAYQQMTDELKAVKAQLAAIEANGALAGAA